MTATPEGKIKTKLKKRLAQLNLKYEFWPVQMGFGSTTLDCLLCVAGWFVAIETKAPGKKLTPRQTKTRLDIEAAGGLVLVVDSEESLEIAMWRMAYLEQRPRMPRPSAYNTTDAAA